ADLEADRDSDVVPKVVEPRLEASTDSDMERIDDVDEEAHGDGEADVRLRLSRLLLGGDREEHARVEAHHLADVKPHRHARVDAEFPDVRTVDEAELEIQASAHLELALQEPVRRTDFGQSWKRHGLEPVLNGMRPLDRHDLGVNFEVVDDAER